MHFPAHLSCQLTFRVPEEWPSDLELFPGLRAWAGGKEEGLTMSGSFHLPGPEAGCRISWLSPYHSMMWKRLSQVSSISA